MTAEELEQFEEMLLRLQEETMGIADLVAEGTAPVELDQNRVGRLSRMDALQGQALAQASAQRQGQQLRRLSEALQRIDDGDYGDCQRCDNPIPVARLRIDPAAEYCVDCAAAIEA